MPTRGKRPLCSHPGCEKPHSAKGYCGMHYARSQNGWDMDKPPRIKSYEGRECLAPNCGRTPAARGLCNSHYIRHRKGLDLTKPIRRRDTFEWGEWYVNRRGYRERSKIPAPGGKQINQLEHRVVMEEVLGRPLLPKENVHHINGDRADNRAENLELWSTSQPAGQRVADKLKWAREIIDQYQEEEGLL